MKTPTILREPLQKSVRIPAHYNKMDYITNHIWWVESDYFHSGDWIRRYRKKWDTRRKSIRYPVVKDLSNK